MSVFIPSKCYEREGGISWLSENLNYHSGPNKIPHLPKSVIHLGWGIQQKEGRRRNAVIDESFLLDDQLHLSLEVIMGEPECSWTVKTT